MIKLSYFEAFHAVMRTGSMTAAASVLHTSQPNVSRAISRLEKETNLKLFERMPGKLLPTADGRALFEEVQRSFIGLQRLTEAAGRIRRSGSGILRLGAVQTLSLSIVPRAVKRFTDRYPEVKLSIQTAHSSQLSRWVSEHTCDVAIVSSLGVEENIESELLYSAVGVCIMHASHPLAEKDVVTPQDLANERFITFPRGDPPRVLMDRILLDANVDLTQTIETSYSAITCSLVMQGVGVAVVNPHIVRDYLHGGVVARKFVPASPHNAIMIFPKGKPHGRQVDSFVDILKEIAVEEKADVDALFGGPQN